VPSVVNALNNMRKSVSQGCVAHTAVMGYPNHFPMLHSDWKR
jgi:hypothetical protein